MPSGLVSPACSAGSPGALLRRGPLRTGRARFPGNRLRQAPRAHGQAEALFPGRRWWFGGGSGRV
jgi:hypothetical protein